jgi:uncharacterized membrane protein YccC
MLHSELIDFLIQNAGYFCVPIGIAFKYLASLLGHHHSGSESKKRNELLMARAYDHMHELLERGDHALEERMQLLLKNKELAETISVLTSTVEGKQKEIDELQDLYDALQLKYDALLPPEPS